MKIFYLLIALFGVSMGCFCFAAEITSSGIDDKKLTFHIIQRGDTLFSIAKRNGIPLEDLQSWNKIKNLNSVTVGQKITLREPDENKLPFHIIQRGDTLFSIAKKNGIPLENLQSWNKIKNPTSITVGHKITLREPDENHDLNQEKIKHSNNEVTTQVQPGAKKLVSKAKLALTHKYYPLAISLLKELYEIGNEAERQFALEYLGVAREKYGQNEFAKQAYQKFLDHYPAADAAQRVKIRLDNLNDK
ncbi:hypothetical protein A9Q98_12185 [Thalassotalea sp. 42_200_T64]|nr:hypothetical protein A9Q98_12185 [Thalassotalea sp. 42_200_T64]